MASRQHRKDNFLKKLFSKYFYAFLSYLTETKQDETVANFALCHRKAVKAMAAMKDYNRYFPTMIKWVGFKLTTLKIEHVEREDGKSSYTFKKRLKLAVTSLGSISVMNPFLPLLIDRIGTSGLVRAILRIVPSPPIETMQSTFIRSNDSFWNG